MKMHCIITSITCDGVEALSYPGIYILNLTATDLAVDS